MFNSNKALKLKTEIKAALEKGNILKSKSLTKEYEKINPYDFELHSIKSTFYFLENDFESAEIELLKGYNKFEFNFDINYNLAIVYMYKNDFKKQCYYLLRCSFINPDSLNTITSEIENLLYNNYISVEDLQNIKTNVINLFSNINKRFPLKSEGSTYLGNFLLEKDNKGYMCGYYDYYFPERDGILTELSPEQSALLGFYKTECLPSKKLKSISFKTTKKAILPIMKLNSNHDISININEKEYILNNLIVKRFYYYPIKENSSVTLNCEDYFILGNLIELDIDENKPKLVLNIFIDGLSQKFIENNNIKEIMPNTYNFFKKGTICNNCYVSGEWTYVSLASFFTGLCTNQHMVFNPEFGTNTLFDRELFSETIHDNGYFTAKIDGDWRSTPSSGFIKGFDRYLYQPSIRGMHSDDIIIETIEHLEAFKEKNNFIWVCIPDLHDIADEFETRLSTQVHNPLSTRMFIKTSETSVRKTFNENKIFRYKTQLKRIDTYLGLLLNYIESNYKNDEILISLISDHGQGYFINSNNFLDEERIKVPMMFRGRNIPIGTCNELIQGFDLFPIILNSAGIHNFDKKQGNIPKYFNGAIERKYTFSESIFPDSPYRATINDINHKFFFETKENCTLDGRFKAYEYTYKLINKNTKEDETSKFSDKVNEYLEIIFDKIKEHIIIE